MSEQWDIYDVNRQRTGRIIERPSAWGQEAYHLIIHVAIFDRMHRMLIQHRAPGEISGISVPAAVRLPGRKAGRLLKGKPLKNLVSV